MEYVNEVTITTLKMDKPLPTDWAYKTIILLKELEELKVK